MPAPHAATMPPTASATPEARPASASPASPRPARGRLGLWLISVAMLGLLALLAAGMTKDPRELPSVLIGRPWPALALPQLDAPASPIGIAQWRGRPRLINLWASWCGTCREEHPALMALAGTLRTLGRADQLIGLNYKDPHDQATAWLARLGNPYGANVVDADGRMAIELGVYGAPESFLIDAQGRILWRHAGALTPELIAQQVLPRLQEQQP